ncbi:hypothetical protein [Vibrio harveyi]|uniref:hypothetical protein n=1 Tax=Vibrio harveyi TaxID=669 RepID=UPI003CEA352F
MKHYESAEVTFNGVTSCSTSAGRANEVNLDISFETEGDYLSSFLAMAEKISDETLIKILLDRDPECIAEEYRP